MEVLSGNVREISSSFFMFCLFFRQEPRKGHDLSIDPLLTDGSTLAISIHGSHVCQLINAVECKPRKCNEALETQTDVKSVMRRSHTGI